MSAATILRPEAAQAEPALVPQATPVQQDIADGINAVVDRFNERFMLVNDNGKAVIFQPGYDPVLRRRKLDRLSIEDLKILYLNDKVVVGLDDKGRPMRKTAAEVWLNHPRRRQFIGGVTFDPAGEAAPGILNLWAGYAVAPAPGDWSLMRAHIERNICCGDPARFDYLMGWMARMFQHPAEQGEVAIVMRSGEGTGKGTLAKAIMRIVGQHGLPISNSRHLVGNFNAHLRNCVFLFADEAFFAGDRAHVGVLKSIITEPELTLEGKFQNATKAPNFLHVMMASNEEWVVPASLDARRFFVLDVADRVKGDHAYFAAIWKQMEAGGYGAMLHDLLQRDLTTFNVRAVPVTEALQRQRKLSLGTTEAWWLDCLERGYVFRSKHGLEDYFDVWRPQLSTELLMASYLDFAKARGERRPLSREDLGSFFRSLEAISKRERNGVIGEHIKETDGLHGPVRRPTLMRHPRPPGYLFGSLEEARAVFTKITGLSVVWDGGAPDEPED